MTTTAEVITDAAQADGRRYVRYRYTHDSGRTFEHGPKLVPADHDAQAEADALIPRIEVQAAEQEKRAAVDAVLGGVALDDLTLAFNTKAQVLSFLARRLFNLMKRRDLAPDALYRIRRALPRIGSYSNAQIASVTGWTEAQVADARDRLIAYKNSTDAIDHGLPEFEGVD